MKTVDKINLYDTMILTYEYLQGIKKAPYRDYPYNYTGLLHKADNTLIFSTDPGELKAAEHCRAFAIMNINKGMDWK